MGRKRRKFTDNFKAQVALEALRGDRTIQEIAAKHNVLPTQVSTWSEVRARHRFERRAEHRPSRGWRMCLPRAAALMIARLK